MPTPYLINNSSAAAGSSTIVITPASTTGAGDVYEVNVYTNATGVAKVTDAKGNSYILVAQKGTLWRFVTTGKTVALTNTDPITATFTGTGQGNATAIGIPGVAFAGVDVVNGATGTSTSPAVTGSGGYSAQPAFATAALANAGSAASWGAGFTGLGSSHGASTEFLDSAWKNVTDGSANVTPSATITSAAWSMLVTVYQLTSFAGTVPPAPSQFAGTVSSSSDMNKLASAALFERQPPLVIARSKISGTGQSLTSATDVPIQWDMMTRDTDGFWAPANLSRLTVQTQGLYKATYSVPFAAASVSCQCKVKITTGANNPAGAGVSSVWWYAYSAAGNSNDGCVCGGGIIPLLLYPLDFVEITANTGTTGNMPITPQPAIASLRMVST